MSDEAYLDDSRDPNADTGSHAARFAGGVDEREPAPRVADGRRPIGSVVASRYTLTARLATGASGRYTKPSTARFPICSSGSSTTSHCTCCIGG